MIYWPTLHAPAGKSHFAHMVAAIRLWSACSWTGGLARRPMLTGFSKVGPPSASTSRALGGICDAILGEGDVSRGVVEVEGSRHECTLRELGEFFSSEIPDPKTLEFGIFLAYLSEKYRGLAKTKLNLDFDRRTWGKGWPLAKLLALLHDGTKAFKCLIGDLVSEIQELITKQEVAVV